MLRPKGFENMADFTGRSGPMCHKLSICLDINRWLFTMTESGFPLTNVMKALELYLQGIITKLKHCFLYVSVIAHMSECNATYLLWKGVIDTHEHNSSKSFPAIGLLVRVINCRLGEMEDDLQKYLSSAMTGLGGSVSGRTGKYPELSSFLSCCFRQLQDLPQEALPTVVLFTQGIMNANMAHLQTLVSKSTPIYLVFMKFSSVSPPTIHCNLAMLAKLAVGSGGGHDLIDYSVHSSPDLALECGVGADFKYYFVNGSPNQALVASLAQHVQPLRLADTDRAAYNKILSVFSSPEAIAVSADAQFKFCTLVMKGLFEHRVLLEQLICRPNTAPTPNSPANPLSAGGLGLSYQMISSFNYWVKYPPSAGAIGVVAQGIMDDLVSDITKLHVKKISPSQWLCVRSGFDLSTSQNQNQYSGSSAVPSSSTKKRGKNQPPRPYSISDATLASVVRTGAGSANGATSGVGATSGQENMMWSPEIDDHVVFIVQISSSTQCNTDCLCVSFRCLPTTKTRWVWLADLQFSALIVANCNLRMDSPGHSSRVGPYGSPAASSFSFYGGSSRKSHSRSAPVCMSVVLRQAVEKSLSKQHITVISKIQRDLCPLLASVRVIGTKAASTIAAAAAAAGSNSLVVERSTSLSDRLVGGADGDKLVNLEMQSAQSNTRRFKFPHFQRDAGVLRHMLLSQLSRAKVCYRMEPLVWAAGVSTMPMGGGGSSADTAYRRTYDPLFGLDEDEGVGMLPSPHGQHKQLSPLAGRGNQSGLGCMQTFPDCGVLQFITLCRSSSNGLPGETLLLCQIEHSYVGECDSAGEGEEGVLAVDISYHWESSCNELQYDSIVWSEKEHRQCLLIEGAIRDFMLQDEQIFQLYSSLAQFSINAGLRGVASSLRVSPPLAVQTDWGRRAGGGGLAFGGEHRFTATSEGSVGFGNIRPGGLKSNPIVLSGREWRALLSFCKTRKVALPSFPIRQKVGQSLSNAVPGSLDYGSNPLNIDLITVLSQTFQKGLGMCSIHLSDCVEDFVGSFSVNNMVVFVKLPSCAPRDHDRDHDCDHDCNRVGRAESDEPSMLIGACTDTREDSLDGSSHGAQGGVADNVESTAAPGDTSTGTSADSEPGPMPNWESLKEEKGHMIDVSMYVLVLPVPSSLLLVDHCLSTPSSPTASSKGSTAFSGLMPVSSLLMSEKLRLIVGPPPDGAAVKEEEAEAQSGPGEEVVATLLEQTKSCVWQCHLANYANLVHSTALARAGNCTKDLDPMLMPLRACDLELALSVCTPVLKEFDITTMCQKRGLMLTRNSESAAAIVNSVQNSFRASLGGILKSITDIEDSNYFAIGIGLDFDSEPDSVSATTGSSAAGTTGGEQGIAVPSIGMGMLAFARFSLCCDKSDEEGAVRLDNVCGTSSAVATAVLGVCREVEHDSQVTLSVEIYYCDVAAMHVQSSAPVGVTKPGGGSLVSRPFSPVVDSLVSVIDSKIQSFIATDVLCSLLEHYVFAPQDLVIVQDCLTKLSKVTSMRSSMDLLYPAENREALQNILKVDKASHVIKSARFMNSFAHFNDSEGGNISSLSVVRTFEKNLQNLCGVRNTGDTYYASGWRLSKPTTGDGAADSDTKDGSWLPCWILITLNYSVQKRSFPDPGLEDVKRKKPMEMYIISVEYAVLLRAVCGDIDDIQARVGTSLVERLTEAGVLTNQEALLHDMHETFPLRANPLLFVLSKDAVPEIPSPSSSPSRSRASSNTIRPSAEAMSADPAAAGGTFSAPSLPGEGELGVLSTSTTSSAATAVKFGQHCTYQHFSAGSFVCPLQCTICLTLEDCVEVETPNYYENVLKSTKSLENFVVIDNRNQGSGIMVDRDSDGTVFYFFLQPRETASDNSEWELSDDRDTISINLYGIRPPNATKCAELKNLLQGELINLSAKAVKDSISSINKVQTKDKKNVASTGGTVLRLPYVRFMKQSAKVRETSFIFKEFSYHSAIFEKAQKQTTDKQAKLRFRLPVFVSDIYWFCSIAKQLFSVKDGGSNPVLMTTVSVSDGNTILTAATPFTAASSTAGVEAPLLKRDISVPPPPKSGLVGSRSRNGIASLTPVTSQSSLTSLSRQPHVEQLLSTIVKATEGVATAEIDGIASASVTDTEGPSDDGIAGAAGTDVVDAGQHTKRIGDSPQSNSGSKHSVQGIVLDTTQGDIANVIAPPETATGSADLTVESNSVHENVVASVLEQSGTIGDAAVVSPEAGAVVRNNSSPALEDEIIDAESEISDLVGQQQLDSIQISVYDFTFLYDVKEPGKGDKSQKAPAGPSGLALVEYAICGESGTKVGDFGWGDVPSSDAEAGLHALSAGVPSEDLRVNTENSHIFRFFYPGATASYNIDVESLLLNLTNCKVDLSACSGGGGGFGFVRQDDTLSFSCSCDATPARAVSSRASVPSMPAYDLQLSVYPAVNMQTHAVENICHSLFDQALLVYCMERLFQLFDAQDRLRRQLGEVVPLKVSVSSAMNSAGDANGVLSNSSGQSATGVNSGNAGGAKITSIFSAIMNASSSSLSVGTIDSEVDTPGGTSTLADANREVHSSTAKLNGNNEDLFISHSTIHGSTNVVTARGQSPYALTAENMKLIHLLVAYGRMKEFGSSTATMVPPPITLSQSAATSTSSSTAASTAQTPAASPLHCAGSFHIPGTLSLPAARETLEQVLLLMEKTSTSSTPTAPYLALLKRSSPACVVGSCTSLYDTPTAEELKVGANSIINGRDSDAAGIPVQPSWCSVKNADGSSDFENVVVFSDFISERVAATDPAPVSVSVPVPAANVAEKVEKGEKVATAATTVDLRFLANFDSTPPNSGSAALAGSSNSLLPPGTRRHYYLEILVLPTGLFLFWYNVKQEVVNRLAELCKTCVGNITKAQAVKEKEVLVALGLTPEVPATAPPVEGMTGLVLHSQISRLSWGCKSLRRLYSNAPSAKRSTGLVHGGVSLASTDSVSACMAMIPLAAWSEGILIRSAEIPLPTSKQITEYLGLLATYCAAHDIDIFPPVAGAHGSCDPNNPGGTASPTSTVSGLSSSPATGALDATTAHYIVIPVPQTSILVTMELRSVSDIGLRLTCRLTDVDTVLRTQGVDLRTFRRHLCDTRDPFLGQFTKALRIMNKFPCNCRELVGRAEEHCQLLYPGAAIESDTVASVVAGMLLDGVHFADSSRLVPVTLVQHYEAVILLNLRLLESALSRNRVGAESQEHCSGARVLEIFNSLSQLLPNASVLQDIALRDCNLLKAVTAGDHSSASATFCDAESTSILEFVAVVAEAEAKLLQAGAEEGAGFVSGLYGSSAKGSVVSSGEQHESCLRLLEARGTGDTGGLSTAPKILFLYSLFEVELEHGQTSATSNGGFDYTAVFNKDEKIGGIVVFSGAADASLRDMTASVFTYKTSASSFSSIRVPDVEYTATLRNSGAPRTDTINSKSMFAPVSQFSKMSALKPKDYRTAAVSRPCIILQIDAASVNSMISKARGVVHNALTNSVEAGGGVARGVQSLSVLADMLGQCGPGTVTLLCLMLKIHTAVARVATVLRLKKAWSSWRSGVVGGGTKAEAEAVMTIVEHSASCILEFAAFLDGSLSRFYSYVDGDTRLLGALRQYFSSVSVHRDGEAGLIHLLINSNMSFAAHIQVGDDASSTHLSLIEYSPLLKAPLEFKNTTLTGSAPNCGQTKQQDVFITYVIQALLHAISML